MPGQRYGVAAAIEHGSSSQGNTIDKYTDYRYKENRFAIFGILCVAKTALGDKSYSRTGQPSQIRRRIGAPRVKYHR